MRGSENRKKRRKGKLGAISQHYFLKF